jgi:hypothetical protein
MEEDPSAPRLFDDPNELLNKPPNTPPTELTPAEARFLEHEQGGSFGEPVRKPPKSGFAPGIASPIFSPAEIETPSMILSEEDFREIARLTRIQVLKIYTRQLIKGGKTAKMAPLHAKPEAFRMRNTELFDKIFGDICEEKCGQRFTPLDIPVEWERHQVIDDVTEDFDSISQKGLETRHKGAIPGQSYGYKLDKHVEDILGVDSSHTIRLSNLLHVLGNDIKLSRSWRQLSPEEKDYYIDQYLRRSI